MIPAGTKLFAIIESGYGCNAVFSIISCTLNSQSGNMFRVNIIKNIAGKRVKSGMAYCVSNKRVFSATEEGWKECASKCLDLVKEKNRVLEQEYLNFMKLHASKTKFNRQVQSALTQGVHSGMKTSWWKHA